MRRRWRRGWRRGWRCVNAGCPSHHGGLVVLTVVGDATSSPFLRPAAPPHVPQEPGPPRPPRPPAEKKEDTWTTHFDNLREARRTAAANAMPPQAKPSGARHFLPLQPELSEEVGRCVQGPCHGRRRRRCGRARTHRSLPRVRWGSTLRRLGGGGDPRQLARPNMPRRGFLCGSTWSRLTSVYASSTRPTRCGRKPRRCTRRASTLRGRDARATTPCWTTSRRGSCARRTRRSGRQRGPGGGLTRSRSCGPLSGRRFSSTFSATASLSQSTERSSMLSTKTLAS